jgi:hypothetical protein
MIKRCEAVIVCHTGHTPAGSRCPETKVTRQPDGRWLCWVHHYNVLHPEARKRFPQKYVSRTEH